MGANVGADVVGDRVGADVVGDRVGGTDKVGCMVGKAPSTETMTILLYHVLSLFK